MKCLGLLLVLLLLTGCSSTIPDLSDVREEKAVVYHERDPQSSSEETQESETKVTHSEPQDWSGPILHWTLLEAPMITPSFPIDRINAYLEQVGAEYRVSMNLITVDLNSPSLGRTYHEKILELAKEKKVDVVNVGYRHISSEDELVLPLLLDQGMVEPFSKEGFSFGSELVLDGVIYGTGNPSFSGYHGFFTSDDQLEIPSGDAIKALQYIEDQDATLYLSETPTSLLPSYLIGDILLWENQKLMYFWETEAFKDLASILERLWEKNLITSDNKEADVFFSMGYLGDLTSSMTLEPGTFYPIGLTPHPSNWYVSTENILLAQSDVKEEARDFLTRLDQDQELALILAGVKGRAPQQADVVNMPTRVFNELLLYPDLLSSFAQRSELEKGIRISAELTDSLLKLKDEAHSNHELAFDILYNMKPGWRAQAKLLGEQISSEEFDELLQQVERSISDQLKGER